MNKRIYRMPIMGGVKKLHPLKGIEGNTLQIIPLDKLPGYDQLVSKNCEYVCLEYNIDEEWCDIELNADDAFHNWLQQILPSLKGLAKVKGWLVDKSRVEK